jgi:hypothetical protein
VQGVGDEAAGALVFETALDDGMAAVVEFEEAAAVDFWADPAAEGGEMREAGRCAR